MKNNAKATDGSNNLVQTSYAAGRKRDQILSKALADSTNAFLQQNNFKKGMIGMDLGCGIGDVTLLLKSKIGEEGKMIGVGVNPKHIEIARESALIQNQKNVEFFQKSILDCRETETYDFVYSRLFLSQIQDREKALKQVFNSLKKGGFVMVEEMNMASYHCFPSCYAFKRFKELAIELKKRQGMNALIGEELFSLFKKINFEYVQIQVIKPAFLKAEEKQIPSLTLEHLRDDLLAEKLTTKSELQALIIELKSYEERDDSLISLPGVYQISGYRF